MRYRALLKKSENHCVTNGWKFEVVAPPEDDTISSSLTPRLGTFGADALYALTHQLVFITWRKSTNLNSFLAAEL